MDSNNLKSWILSHDATTPPAGPVSSSVPRPVLVLPVVSTPAPVAVAPASAPLQPQPRVARKLPRLALPQLSRTTQLTVLAAAAGVVLVVGGTLLAGRLRRPQPGGSSGSSSSAGSGASQSGLPHDKPSFSLAYPAGKSAASLEIVRISPDGRDPVFAFYDKLQGQTILVSEQKLPSQFSSGQASELERTAKEFQATSVIQIDGQKVYHGLSDRSKTQSLIFIKKDLLILIKSPEKLSDTDWVGYISGLR